MSSTSCDNVKLGDPDVTGFGVCIFFVPFPRLS